MLTLVVCFLSTLLDIFLLLPAVFNQRPRAMKSTAHARIALTRLASNISSSTAKTPNICSTSLRRPRTRLSRQPLSANSSAVRGVKLKAA